MDTCRLLNDHVVRWHFKRQQHDGNSESALWVTGASGNQPGQLPSPSDKRAVSQELCDQRHPRFATKAATAAKRLQAVAAIREPACLPTSVTAECRPFLVDVATATTANAGAPTAGQPAKPDASGPARCTAGRGRLPGLRSLNGLRPLGLASAHGPSTIVPLLLASSRGGEFENQGYCAAAGSGQAVCRALATGLALRCLEPAAAARRPSPPSAFAAPSPAATCSFLPPAKQPPVARAQETAVRLQSASDAAPPDATGPNGGNGTACADQAVAGKGVGPVPVSGPAAHGGRSRRGGSSSSGGGGDSRASTRRTACWGVDGISLLPQPKHPAYDEVSELSSSDRSDDSGSDRDLEDDVSSYSSCCSSYSCSSDEDDGSSVETMQDGVRESGTGHDLESHKRRRVFAGEGGASPAAAGSPVPTAAVVTAAAGGRAPNVPSVGVTPGGGGDGAASPAAAAAAGSADVKFGGCRRRRRRCGRVRPRGYTYFHYGPPWPLVPRAGRAGHLRLNMTAVREVWPDLVVPAQKEPQLVTLNVELPAVGGGEGNGGADGDGGKARLIPVRALLRPADDSSMLLRVLEEWPSVPGVTTDSLLQIARHPGGDGALVQAANRHVWSYYCVRGGKLLGRGGAAAGGGGGGVGAPAGGREGGGGGATEETAVASGVLQLRLGASLFDNRCFDVGIRAAERLFGHLLKGGANERSAAAGEVGAADGGGDAKEAGGPAVDPAAVTAAATAAAAVLHIPIQSLSITVVTEAWPEARFQVELRHRFPRMYGMRSNARHAYAALSSNVVGAMMLYGAQPGDVFELWRRPGGSPDEFLCRVVRYTAGGGVDVGGGRKKV